MVEFEPMTATANELNGGRGDWLSGTIFDRSDRAYPIRKSILAAHLRLWNAVSNRLLICHLSLRFHPATAALLKTTEEWIEAEGDGESMLARMPWLVDEQCPEGVAQILANNKVVFIITDILPPDAKPIVHAPAEPFLSEDGLTKIHEDTGGFGPTWQLVVVVWFNGGIPDRNLRRRALAAATRACMEGITVDAETLQKLMEEEPASNRYIAHLEGMAERAETPALKAAYKLAVKQLQELG